ncbi:family 20 glycosylhydrolase, partial [Acinetobacter baumannii]|nr:family 20 glycosylhydrolase [Acinetobacter baumannii]
MLDCSRHFFSVDEIKRLLDLMLLHKLNIFHWHLTDDQGWRIEIKKYPLLTEIGAKRKATQRTGWKEKNIVSVSDPERDNGYYTQEE